MNLLARDSVSAALAAIGFGMENEITVFVERWRS
jgi:hypothetical protein